MYIALVQFLCANKLGFIFIVETIHIAWRNRVEKADAKICIVKC